MRLSKILNRQHLDRMFKFHWRLQGNRIPQRTQAEEVLAAKGIPVYDPKEIIHGNRAKGTRIKLNIVGFAPKPLPLDNTHPQWNDTVCYFYRDDNVLLEGLEQAKIITKTVEVKQGLPDKYQSAAEPVSKHVNKKVLRIILSSRLLDTEQEKLPKIKDPLRPAFNFPRILGITFERANNLLTTRLLQLCETLADKHIVQERTILNDAQFLVPLKKQEDLLQFHISADKLLLSTKPLETLTKESVDEIALPDLYPIKHTITLVPENIYELQNIYPVKNHVSKYPHTIFVHYDPTKVRNLHEEQVTETQILGRSLMKTFTAAAAFARQKYGNDVKDLPQPITLQCIQTDGKLFHFAVLQLNTLNLEEGGFKNIWYQMPRIPLFQSCEYKVGKPVVEGYNSEVIKYLLAFYNNV